MKEAAAESITVRLHLFADAMTASLIANVLRDSMIKPPTPTSHQAPRVLVTGANGNVGREVALECARRGFIVRVADRRQSVLRERFAALEAVPFDFFDRGTWDNALADCDYVFLLRPPPVGDMDATLNPFVDAAYAASVKHVVFLSVAGADKMKWVPHRKVELHLAANGRQWTVLRPGFFAQNLQDAYRRDILEEGRLYVPAGKGRVAFIDVRDIAEVATEIFGDPNAYCEKALTLTGPSAITFEQVAVLLSNALKRPIVYEAASIVGYAWHLWTKRKMALMQIVVQTILHTGLRRGDAEKVDLTVQQLLGRPARSVQEYLAYAVAADGAGFSP